MGKWHFRVFSSMLMMFRVFDISLYFLQKKDHYLRNLLYLENDSLFNQCYRVDITHNNIGRCNIFRRRFLIGRDLLIYLWSQTSVINFWTLFDLRDEQKTLDQIEKIGSDWNDWIGLKILDRMKKIGWDWTDWMRLKRLDAIDRLLLMSYKFDLLNYPGNLTNCDSESCHSY